MKRIGITLAMALLASIGFGQSLENYLAKRSEYGIQTASSAEALTTFVGERVMEVKGVVKGSIGASGSMSLMIALPDGGIFSLKAGDVPDWLRYPNTSARLILKASRTSELAPIDAKLLGAAPEGQIATYEKAQAEIVLKRQEAEAALNAQRATGTTVSRGGGRPPRFPGEIPPVRQAPVATPGLSPALLEVLPAYTAFVLGQNPRLGEAKAREIAASILSYSAKFGVDARLICALVVCESAFNPNVVSHAGAQGLGQLMPGTARGLGVSNVFDTDQNLHGTVKLLTGHLNTYSQTTENELDALMLALAAYNAGPGAVRRYNGVPPYRETQNYVKKVIATYRQLCGQ